MGLDDRNLSSAAREHLLLHFTPHASSFGGDGNDLLVLERGEGPYVFDSSGRRYLDGLSSLFCSQLGYSYGAEMADAAAAQLTRLGFNTNWGTAHPPAIELAQRLTALTPPDLNKVFFTSGGSEAVETAWKLARQFHVANGEPEREKAIARKVAYHGVTSGALSLTGVDSFKGPFGAPAIQVRRVSNTNGFRREEAGSALTRALLDEIEDAILAEGPETVAMIIAEPVQNAGGCLVPPDGYWLGLRELCDRYGILLVADEVITGFGRLGEWFGAPRFGGSPDMMTTAKGITSAYAPMGALFVSDRVAAFLYEEGQTLLHGLTFGGHPLSAAIALRNLEIFARDGVLAHVRALEPYLEERLDALRTLPIVGDVRGAGFFWALELVRDESNERFEAAERDELLRRFIPRRLREVGLIARADDRGDSVLTLAPPLICGRAEIDELVEMAAQVLTDAGTHMVGIRGSLEAASAIPTGRER